MAYETRLRRAHSISGVVPLGAFLVLHVLGNASALVGEQTFTASVRAAESLQGVLLLEMTLVILPLVFHAVSGVMLARKGLIRSPYPSAWRKWLGVTGYGAGAFVLLHVWQTSAQKWLHGLSPLAFHTTLEARLSSTTWGVPWIAIAYLAGVGCACFHFATGLWGFSITWSLAQSERAQRRVAWAGGALGVILFVLGASTVVRYATGSSVVTAVEPLPHGPPRPACSSVPP